jgi:hypothetical protein
MRRNNFGRYSVQTHARSLLREIYDLMENQNVIPFLWNLNQNNGFVDHRFYNRRPRNHQKDFMRIIYIFDKLLRNQQLLDVLFNDDNNFTNAFVQCLEHNTIDPVHMTLYLFRELY